MSRTWCRVKDRVRRLFIARNVILDFRSFISNASHFQRWRTEFLPLRWGITLILAICKRHSSSPCHRPPFQSSRRLWRCRLSGPGQSRQTQRCLRRGRPMVSRVASLGTLAATSTGTHLRMEQLGFRPDQQQAYQGARGEWQQFFEAWSRCRIGLLHGLAAKRSARQSHHQRDQDRGSRVPCRRCEMPLCATK